MDGEISSARKTRSTRKDQPKSASISNVSLLSAGRTSGQRPDSRNSIYPATMIVAPDPDSRRFCWFSRGCGIAFSRQSLKVEILLGILKQHVSDLGLGRKSRAHFSFSLSLSEIPTHFRHSQGLTQYRLTKHNHGLLKGFLQVRRSPMAGAFLRPFRHLSLNHPWVDPVPAVVTTLLLHLPKQRLVPILE